MSKDIIDFVTERYNDKSLGAKLKQALQDCQIPIPKNDQYFKSFDNGYIIFRNLYGSTVRIVEHEKHPLYDHPHLLRPLGALLLGKLRLEIDPGGICPVSKKDAVMVHETLARDGLAHPYATSYSGSEHQPDIHKPYNNIYLPTKTDIFSSGFPVLVDFGHVVDLTKSTKKIENTLNSRVIDFFLDRTPDIQDVCFAPLRHTFLDAFRNGYAPQTMASFWNAMKNATQQGELVASWVQSVEPQQGFISHNKGKIPEISKRYETEELVFT